jgi:hypothetical protein
MFRATMLLEQGEGNWRSLFQPTDFFQRHANFLQISIRAKTSSDFLKWLRFCESRMRLMITSLETPQIMAWPFAKFFERRATKEGHEALFFIALRFAPGVEAFNIRYLTSDFLYNVNSWEERVTGMDMGISHVLQPDLPRCVLEHWQEEQHVDGDDDEEQQLTEEPISTMETEPTPTPIIQRTTDTGITSATRMGEPILSSRSIDSSDQLSQDSSLDPGNEEMTDEVPELAMVPPRSSTTSLSQNHSDNENLLEPVASTSPTSRPGISEDDISIGSPLKRARCKAPAWRRTNSCNI